MGPNVTNFTAPEPAGASRVENDCTASRPGLPWVDRTLWRLGDPQCMIF
jgi:hypothetical protein